MNRPYPRRCAECGTKAVHPAVVEFRSQVKHENVLHDVVVQDLPVHKCDNCGSITVGEDADARIKETLRSNLGLLKSSTILACREELGYTQRRIAELCGFAPEPWSRWENGALQSRSTDRFMRVLFGVPEARSFLANLEADPTLGETVVWGNSGNTPRASRVQVEYVFEMPSVCEKTTVPVVGVDTGRQQSAAPQSTTEQGRAPPSYKLASVCSPSISVHF